MARLNGLCRQLMLRRTKKGIDAKGQLRLPKQREIIRRLDFSAVEAHFYQQQFEESSRSIRSHMSNHSATAIVSADGDVQECSSSLQPEQPLSEHDSTATADLLSNTLLTLRQAACHPQLGTRGIGTHSQGQGHGSSKGRRLGRGSSSQVTHKGMQVLTMDQILFKLIDEAKLKCEESQRKLLMQFAASAGVFQVQAELSTSNETQTQPQTAAVLHFLSKARGVYAEAMRTYGGNRQPCLVLGTMTVSSLPPSLSPPLHSRDPAPAATVTATAVSYDCRANELTMCWVGRSMSLSSPAADQQQQQSKDHTAMSMATLLSSPVGRDDLTAPSVLGCQLDNSSASASAAASNRRILQLKYRLDIVPAIQALLSQRVGGGSELCSMHQAASSRYVSSEQRDMCWDDAMEHLGTIYFPRNVTFQVAGNGSVFVNSHR